MWSKLEKNDLVLLGVLLGFSLLIKVVLVYQADIINDDGIRYINSAHELFRGNFAAAFAHEKMLGFVSLLGLAHLLVPDWFLAGKILSSTVLILATIPLYLIAHELFGRRAAICTALVFTIAPTINDKCTAVIKDPPFLFLILLSLCLLLYALRESGWKLPVAAGFIGSASVLIRPEGLVFVAAVVLFLVVASLFLPEHRGANLRSLAFFCVPLGVALIAAALALVTGLVTADALTSVYARFSAYVQLDLLQSYRLIYEHLKAVEESFFGGQWSNDFFEHARANILLIYLVGMLQVFCKEVSIIFILPLLLGLKLSGRWNRQTVLFLAVLGSFLLMDYFFLVSRNFISNRYMLLPVVMSFVLVGHGVERMASFDCIARLRKAVLATVIVLCLLLQVGMSFRDLSREKEEVKVAGVWLQENRDLSQVRILVTDERIAFYAGLLRGAYDTLEDQSLQALEAQALEKDCGAFVVYRRAKEGRTVELEHFTLVKTVSGRKNVAEIFERKV